MSASHLHYLILSLTVLLLSACAGFGERFAEEEIMATQSLTWNDIEPIFLAECVGCHDDPPKLGAPQSLRNYDEVAPWLNRIKVRSLDLKDMPPGGLRTQGAEILLSEWIRQGAPFTDQSEEMAGEQAGEMAGETAGEMTKDSPSWEHDIYPLFEIYCNTCHANPPTGGAPFPLKMYEQAQPYLDRFQVRVIELQDMPPGGISNLEDLELLQTWLDLGAPQ